MHQQEELVIQNWADFIDALQTFHPSWPMTARQRLQRRALEEDPGAPPQAPAVVSGAPEA